MEPRDERLEENPWVRRIQDANAVTFVETTEWCPEEAVRFWQAAFDATTPCFAAVRAAACRVPLVPGTGSTGFGEQGERSEAAVFAFLQAHSLEPDRAGHWVPPQDRAGSPVVWRAFLEEHLLSPLFVCPYTQTTPLFWAVRRADRGLVRYFLNTGVPLNERNCTANALSAVEPYQHWYGIAIDLVASGARYLPGLHDGLLARLMQPRSCVTNNEEDNQPVAVVDALLNAGASPLDGGGGDNALVRAAQHQPRRVIERLIRGMDPTGAAIHQAFRAAVGRGQADAVRLFLESGCRLVDAYGRRVLNELLQDLVVNQKHAWSANGRHGPPHWEPPNALLEVVDALLIHGARGDDLQAGTNSPIVNALNLGNRTLIDRLLPTSDKLHHHPVLLPFLHAPADLPAVRRLVNAGFHLDAADSSGRTALGWALSQEDFPTAFALLQMGADPQAMHWFGNQLRAAWDHAPDSQRRDTALAELAKQALLEATPSLAEPTVVRRPRF